MSEIEAYGNYSLLDNHQESPLYTAKYDYKAQGMFLILHICFYVSSLYYCSIITIIIAVLFTF